MNLGTSVLAQSSGRQMGQRAIDTELARVGLHVVAVDWHLPLMQRSVQNPRVHLRIHVWLCKAMPLHNRSCSEILSYGMVMYCIVLSVTVWLAVWLAFGKVFQHSFGGYALYYPSHKRCMHSLLFEDLFSLKASNVTHNIIHALHTCFFSGIVLLARKCVEQQGSWGICLELHIPGLHPNCLGGGWRNLFRSKLPAKWPRITQNMFGNLTKQWLHNKR